MGNIGPIRRKTDLEPIDPGVPAKPKPDPRPVPRPAVPEPAKVAVS